MLKVGDSHISTRSAGNGQCVQVSRPVGGNVVIRHSRYELPAIAFTDDEWRAFVEGVKAGEFDLA